MFMKTSSGSMMADEVGWRILAVIFCAVISALPGAHAATYTVSSTSQLQLTAANADPGDVILLTPGSYGSVSIHAPGLAGNPITIKPQIWGAVKFVGTLTLGGDDVIFDGFEFEGAGKLVIDEGDDILITNCIFDDLSAGVWLEIKENSQRVTVERNAFTDKDNSSICPPGQLLQMRMPPSGPMGHVIRWNYFADIVKGTCNGGNGYETIQINQQQTTSDRVTNVLVERNLFERADGEGELISVKASGNIIRYNTFRQSKGALVFRHGDDNQAEGNIFLGEGVSGTGGIRFQGDNHVIVNNYFEGITGTGNLRPLVIMDGTSDNADPYYEAVNTATVAFNSFIDSSPILFGSGGGGITPPEDLRFRNNLLLRTSGSADFIALADNESPGLGDDQLIDPIFEGNIYFGSALGLDDDTGFQSVDPDLIRVFVGLLGPDADSPLIDASDSSYQVPLDLFGRARTGGIVDVGAVEGITDFTPHQPLDRNDVGPVVPPSPATDPDWLAPLRNLIAF